jgi:hypothetical protein
MKKILLAVCVVALAACGTKNDYRSALPKDAAVVAGFNPKSLGDKMNATDFTTSNLATLIGKNLSDEDRALVLPLLADPKESGLSMADDIYFFLTKERAMGILAKVADGKKVAEVVAKAGLTPVSEGDWNFAGLMGDQTAVAAYNDKTFLFYNDEQPYSAAAPKLQALLAQKGKDGLMGVKHAAAALKGGDDFCAVVSYGAMMELANELPGASTDAMMAGMGMMKDAEYVVTGNFEKGRIVADADVVFTNKDSEKSYFEMVRKISGKLNGSSLKYVPEEVLLAFSGNIKGAGLYEIMMGVPEFKELAGQAAPIKAVLESIEGDITMALTSFDAKQAMPSFVVMAELAKPDVILGYAAMASALGAKSDGENRWVVDAGRMKFYFGVMDKLFYVTNNEASYAALGGEKLASIDSRYDVFKGYGGFVVDLAKAGEAVKTMHLGIDTEWVTLMEMFGTLEASTPEPGRSHVVVTTADPNKNAAEVAYTALQAAAGHVHL